MRLGKLGKGGAVSPLGIFDRVGALSDEELEVPLPETKGGRGAVPPETEREPERFDELALVPAEGSTERLER